MKRTPFVHCMVGTLTGCLFILIYFLYSIIMLISFTIACMIPFTALRLRAQHRCMSLYSLAWASFYIVSRIFKLWQWTPPKEPKLEKDGWYLVIANHSSWLDILIAGIFFRFKIPALKFFLKKELRWGLPLAGLACQLAGFPFLDRSSSKRSKNKTPKDIQTAQNTCHNLLKNPSTLILFPEGTRFNQDKQLSQKSPYQHLLKPKSAGIATVINEMHHRLEGIIDLTLNYNPDNISIWDFLSGKLSSIEINYRVIPITPDLLGDYRSDRNYRRRLQAWLNDCWDQKDHLLKGMSDE